MDEFLKKLFNEAIEKYFKAAVEEMRKYDAIPEVLTLSETAELLRVSADWVRRSINKYNIPYFKTGSDYKFRKKQLLEWIDKNIDILNKNGKRKVC